MSRRLEIVKQVLREQINETGYGNYVSDEVIEKLAKAVVDAIEECEK